MPVIKTKGNEAEERNLASKMKEEYGDLIEEAEVFLKEEDIKRKLPSDADFIEDEKQIKVFLNPNRSSNSPGPRKNRNVNLKTTSNLSDPVE